MSLAETFITTVIEMLTKQSEDSLRDEPGEAASLPLGYEILNGIASSGPKGIQTDDLFIRACVRLPSMYMPSKKDVVDELNVMLQRGWVKADIEGTESHDKGPSFMITRMGNVALSYASENMARMQRWRTAKLEQSSKQPP